MKKSKLARLIAAICCFAMLLTACIPSQEHLASLTFCLWNLRNKGGNIMKLHASGEDYL